MLSESARKYFGECAKKGNDAMPKAKRVARAKKAAAARWSKAVGTNAPQGKQK